jgi:signal transduction histidine kinase
VMSHELRTPLFAISALSTMILEIPAIRNGGKRFEEVVEMLEVVRKSGDMLVTIINNILDFSKFEDELYVSRKHLTVDGCVPSFYYFS